jgi:hypothetical protein
LKINIKEEIKEENFFKIVLKKEENNNSLSIEEEFIINDNELEIIGFFHSIKKRKIRTFEK